MAEIFEYVDTHTHLDSIYQRIKKPLNWPFEEYAKTFPPGFAGCLTVFSDSFDGALNFIDQGNPKIWGALGIHPHNAISYNDELEECLKKHLQNPRVIALGEIGLDYHYDNSPRDVQMAIFERQCRLAVDLGMPIVVHTREAEKDTLEVFERAIPKDHKVHIHCYTDSPWLVEKILEKWTNAYFGFTGVLTFPKSNLVRESCKKVPLNRLLSETDGPYMAPVPYRGKASNPGYIPVIIKKMAEIHNVDEKTAFITIRENCRQFYGF
ncbi:hydrolase, TatD family protein [Histomonas meleagridis]|uniref:hydrolase, TatD family protein n=1 Tax=Histomonas meleagridis TaxID=135588 RepID=UPI00355A5A22|nr:hydrolase, TatD family protein [Histomonas meleagridis]KAH0802653.1 hydrolase, TatD family protein [Histomonas meleagridis]